MVESGAESLEEEGLSGGAKRQISMEFLVCRKGPGWSSLTIHRMYQIVKQIVL